MNIKKLDYTLLTDGSSDKALESVLTWLLRENGVDYAINSEWADLRRLRKPPKNLSDRIAISLDLYPCDLLFIHRDAEKESRQKRVDEIQAAIARNRESLSITAVCVVPVRMQEAWFLFNEAAIRKAAGNPLGKKPLQLPSIATLEAKPDPKQLLYDLMRQASERTGRDLKKFRPAQLAHQVVLNIDDFSPLRALPAFRALEDDIKQAIQQL